MKEMIEVAFFEAFALALFYSCFCRALFTSKKNTRRDIRWAFTYLGVISLVCVLAPFWGDEPDGITIALIGAIAVVQLTTAYHWRRGVPDKFRKDPSWTSPSTSL